MEGTKEIKKIKEELVRKNIELYEKLINSALSAKEYNTEYIAFLLNCILNEKEKASRLKNVDGIMQKCDTLFEEACRSLELVDEKITKELRERYDSLDANNGEPFFNIGHADKGKAYKKTLPIK